LAAWACEGFKEKRLDGVGTNTRKKFRHIFAEGSIEVVGEGVGKLGGGVKFVWSELLVVKVTPVSDMTPA